MPVRGPSPSAASSSRSAPRTWRLDIKESLLSAIYKRQNNAFKKGESGNPKGWPKTRGDRRTDRRDDMRKPPADWSNAVDLQAKIRGLPDAEQLPRVCDDHADPDQPEDDESFEDPETFDQR
jgi:hypothetical protein